jgi:protein O-mannosyl-transferase
MIALPDLVKFRWLLPGLLVVAAAVGFGGSLRNEFVYWDDPGLILNSSLVQTLNPRIWWSYDPELYIPLTLFVYQILHLIFGFSPAAFHGFSLLVHIGNVLLLFWFLNRIVKDEHVSFLGALLFAIHPLHTEAIAWASALKELLCAFFFLLSVLAYSDSRGTFRRLTPVFYILALLAKVSAVTLPLVLLLMDAHKYGKVEKRHFVEKWFYFAAAGLFGLIALFGRGDGATLLKPFQVVFLAARSIFFYVQKFFWPTDLLPIYIARPIHIESPAFALSFLGALALIGICVRLYKTRPTIAFGIGFFLVTLLPSFLAYHKGGDVLVGADHYAYLPSVGLLIALTGSMLIVPWRRVATAAVLIAASVSLPLSWEQTKTWASTESLFTNVLKVDPTVSAAYNNLGVRALGLGKLNEAEMLFRNAIHYKNSNSKAWVSLTATLVFLKRYNEAESIGREATRRRPDDAGAHLNLAVAFLGQGKRSEAAAEYDKAVQLFPAFAGAIPALEQGPKK